MFLSRHMSQCQRNHAKTKIYWNQPQPELGIETPKQDLPPTNQLWRKSADCFIQASAAVLYSR